MNGTPQRRSTAQPLPADTVSPEEMAKILGQPAPDGADAPVLALGVLEVAVQVALAQGRAAADGDSSDEAAEPVAAGESSSGRSRRRRRRSSSE